MKGILFASLAILILSGCSTTPNQMRESSPNETYTSTKQPKEIMLCIADEWEDSGVVNTRERVNGYSVALALSDGKLRYLADIEAENGVSITRLYKWRSIVLGGQDPWFKDAGGCQ